MLIRFPGLALSAPVLRTVVGLADMRPFATIKGYRRTGGAAVTVERQNRPPQRYRVSLKRYHALREWIPFGGHEWKTSGPWQRNGLATSLWAQQPSKAAMEVTHQPTA